MQRRAHGYYEKCRWRYCLIVFVTLGVFCAPVLLSQEVDFDLREDGTVSMEWGDEDLTGHAALEMDRMILQESTASGQLWGHSLTPASVEPSDVKIKSEQREIRKTYSWGNAEMQFQPHENSLEVFISLENTSSRTVADFGLYVLGLRTEEVPGRLRRGKVQMTLDRPFAVEIPLEENRIFATHEKFKTPVQFGVGKPRGPKELLPILVMGGVPTLDPSSSEFPLLGWPQIPPGQTLELKVVLRFADSDVADATALRPFYSAFRDAQKPFVDWADRRAIGKVVLPSSPRYVTPANPRGWFQSPEMEVESERGREELRENLMQLADKTIKNLKSADAQGVVIWNIEGGHIYSECPFGDPRRLPDIAPEMDAIADDFFERFRDAGLTVGLTIRPSLLYHSEKRDEWTQGAGYYQKDHESFDKEDVVKNSSSAPADERVYPLARRMADKIQYAKDRWDCKIFYIHDNGYWAKASPDHLDDWLLFSAQVIERVREMHPDVLLIPRYAERHWRSTRTEELVDNKDASRFRLDSLRGTEEDRIGGLETPPWVVGNMLRFRHTRSIRASRAVPGRDKVLHQSYWAGSAPYVELALRRKMREYILTLEQHMEYDYEEADKMAADAIPFERTPARVREWQPDAFTVMDVSGAEVGKRGAHMRRSVAWGDILMWDASQAPGTINDIYESGRLKKQRMGGIADHLDLFDREQDSSEPPLSMTWKEGEFVNPARIFGNSSVPKDLRIRLARGNNDRGNLLMVMWQRGQGHTVMLDPELPGLRSDSESVWNLETGQMASSTSPLEVEPDPVAGITSYYIGDSPDVSDPPPAGVMAASSFDEHLEPDVGGGPPEITRDGRAGNLEDGREGKALQVAGAKVPYGVVPSWLNGTIEFSFKAGEIDDEPLRILKLGHHMDLTLSLEKRYGRTGIMVETQELPFDREKEDGLKRKQAFAELRKGTGRWHHVVLTWGLGQYRVFIDGKRAASIVDPVRRRKRDGTVLKPGVMVGDPEADDGAEAMLDSFVIYSWPWSEERAGERKKTGDLTPVEKPGPQPMNIWLWGSFPKDVITAVNARQAKNWSRASEFEVTLYEMIDHGRQRVARATLQNYSGTAIGKLKFKRSEKIESSKEMADDADFDVDDDEEEDDDLGGLGDEFEQDKEYVIEVVPLPEGEGPKTRTVRFSASKEGIDTHEW